MTSQQTLQERPASTSKFTVSNLNGMQISLLNTFRGGEFRHNMQDTVFYLDMADTYQILLSLLLRFTSNEDMQAHGLHQPRTVQEACLLVSHHLLIAIQSQAD